MKRSDIPEKRAQSSQTPARRLYSVPLSIRHPEDSPHNPEDKTSSPVPLAGKTSSTERKKKLDKIWSLGGLSLIELSKRVYNKMLADNDLGRAAQLAYYFLFALFPFLLFLTTLLGYIPIPHILDRLMAYLAQALPGETLALVQDHLRTLASQQRTGLLSFSIIAALWTASSAVLAITDALNRAYAIEESRPWWKTRGIAILLVIGLSLFMVGATILLIFGSHLGSWIANGVGLGDVFALTWNILRWPASIMLLMVGLAILYYFAPDVEQRWRWVTPGSVVAVIGWLIASLGFSYYVTNFGSYNVTYGSIGTVIVLLTWLYLTGIFILLGGEVNAEIEHASPTGKDPGEKALQGRE